MKRSIVGTRAFVLFACVLVMALVRFAFPTPGLADAGTAARDQAGDFYFGEGFRGNPAMIGEAAEPLWPAWLNERYLPVAGPKHDLPCRYRQGPEVNQLQRFVHNSMQSLFVACGIYAVVGGLGSKLANRMDAAAENAFWQAIESTAKRRDDGKNPTGSNFRGH